MSTAGETRDHDVWFPVLFCAYSAVHAWQNEALAVSADLTAVFFWQAELGGHSDFPC
jgi:hypothetical protein